MNNFLLIFLLSFFTYATCKTYVENPEATSLFLFMKTRFELNFRLQSLCDEVSDGETKYKNVLPKFQQFTNCLGEVNKNDNVTGLFDAAPSHENLIKSFATDCPFLSDAEKCADQFSLDIEECLSDNRKSIKNQIIQIAKVSFKYLCNNEDKIIPLITDESKTCFGKFEEKENCNEKFRVQIEQFRNRDEKGFDFSDDDCKEIVEIKDCFKSHLETCNIEKLAEVTDGLLAEIYSVTNCAKE